MNWNLDNVITVAGYECPKEADPQTKRVLRQLSSSESGMLVFTHDDGFSAITRCQLIEIADAIGLCCIVESHRLILLDEEDNKIQQIFDGAQDIRSYYLTDLRRRNAVH